MRPLNRFLSIPTAFRKVSPWKAANQIARRGCSRFPWLNPALMLLAVAAILLASVPVWYCIIWGNERMIALTTRFSPLLILAMTSSALVMQLDLFQGSRRKWMFVLLYASILNAAGIALQSFLLARLEGPDPFGITARLAAQLFTTLVCLAFVIALGELPRQERLFWAIIAGLTLCFILLQWDTFPKKLWRMKPYIALLAPLSALGFPLLAWSITSFRSGFQSGFWSRLASGAQKKANGLLKAGGIIMLLVLALFYYQTTLKHSLTINKKINASDQAFYIAFIKDVHQSGFTSTGDHNRMPLYPYLQALFYQPELTDKAYFLQGKHINIILSLVCLGVLFYLFQKFLRFPQAILLVCIVAFSLYIFKAPYLQAEITFFTLAFISFLLMLRMLQRPTWLLSIATGILTGLAYLTKGTVLPSVFLFAALFGTRLIVHAVRNRKQMESEQRRRLANQMGFLLVFLFLFTAIIYPYTRAVKEKFGRYFYNVNTTVYIWYESFDQALEEEAKYHFTQGWPSDLPDEQTPGLRKYLRDHTPQQIAERFLGGVGKVYQNIVAQHGVTNYFLTYMLIFTVAILLDVKASIRALKEHPFPVLFTVLYFLGYLVSFAWYMPIAGGRRFLFGLFIPFLWVVFLAINQLGQHQITRTDRSPVGVQAGRFFTVANLLVAITLVYNIWFVLTRVMFFGRFGS